VPAAVGGNSSSPLQTEVPTIFRPVNRARSAGPFTHSSKGISIGTKTINDMRLRFVILHPNE
jgi:hypothetical protein